MLPVSTELIFFRPQVCIQVDDEQPGNTEDRYSIKSGTSADYAASVNSDEHPKAVSRPRAVHGEVSSLRSLNDGEDATEQEAGPEKNKLKPSSPAKPYLLSSRTWNHASFQQTDLSKYGVEDHRHQLIERIKKGPVDFVGSLTYLTPGSWLNITKKEDPKPPSYTRENPDDSFRLSIAEMQRMRLRKLQGKLVKHAAQLQFEGTEPDEWETDLQQYTKALQDYDYMVTCSQKPEDPFLVTGERLVDDYLLTEVLKQFPEPLKDKKALSVPGPWDQKSRAVGGTRNENVAKAWAKGFHSRVAMAALGGFLLVGPMWLMVLHNTLYTCLVTTTVFVTVFGLLMARWLDKPMDVMSATAAYAAVLVVFVGLGTDDNSSS
ncbi:hypothetical protein PG991_010865 [Apiospora marii]|uniref:DUF6594 domain-containing protein n=1 Tax=Apiospora marii TaxID=335849 RepID=A0ABR1RDH7_9PEZI